MGERSDSAGFRACWIDIHFNESSGVLKVCCICDDSDAICESNVKASSSSTSLLSIASYINWKEASPMLHLFGARIFVTSFHYCATTYTLKGHRILGALVMAGAVPLITSHKSVNQTRAANLSVVNSWWYVARQVGNACRLVILAPFHRRVIITIVDPSRHCQLTDLWRLAENERGASVHQWILLLRNASS